MSGARVQPGLAGALKKPHVAHPGVQERMGWLPPCVSCFRSGWAGSHRTNLGDLSSLAPLLRSAPLHVENSPETVTKNSSTPELPHTSYPSGNSPGSSGNLVMVVFSQPEHLKHLLSTICREENRALSLSLKAVRAALHPSLLEHPTSCAVRSRLVPSHRTCTMICTVDVCSCALGVRGQSVDLCRECSSPVHSLHPQCLHRPSHRSTRNCSRHLSYSTHCHIHVVFHSAHPIAVKRLQFAWTCLPRSFLLLSKSWAVAAERDSLPSLPSVCNLIDCINLHRRVRDWRRHAGWYTHEQIKHAHIPFHSEH